MERKTRLQKYLPEFMTEFREMNALLGTENPEFDAIHKQNDATLNNFFIETASADAIARYERITGIRPAAGDSLKTRRLRLLLAMGRIKRFTIARLIDTAARLGEEVEAELLTGFRLALDFIAADNENIEILMEEFRASLPAHLEIVVRNVTSVNGSTHTGAMLGMSAVYSFSEVG